MLRARNGGLEAWLDVLRSGDVRENNNVVCGLEGKMELVLYKQARLSSCTMRARLCGMIGGVPYVAQAEGRCRLRVAAI